MGDKLPPKTRNEFVVASFRSSISPRVSCPFRENERLECEINVSLGYYSAFYRHHTYNILDATIYPEFFFTQLLCSQNMNRAIDKSRQYQPKWKEWHSQPWSLLTFWQGLFAKCDKKHGIRVHRSEEASSGNLFPSPLLRKIEISLIHCKNLKHDAGKEIRTGPTKWWNQCVQHVIQVEEVWEIGTRV